jgi:methylthioribose-1-phosphate isomerase
MKIDGVHYRTIWVEDDSIETVRIIDQHKLPHAFEIMELTEVSHAVAAIKNMHVRGAGLIGATAGFGMYLAALKNQDEDFLKEAAFKLLQSRPTAKNLEWAINRQLAMIRTVKKPKEKIDMALITAQKISDEDAEFCKRIGKHGLPVIEEIYNQKKSTVNILTHCNAGWLAFVDHGSATSPIYAAYDKGIPVHVWVDETRPRNQGAGLTAWELGKHGVPHHLIVDNAGGHLMQHGEVDIVMVGSDRTTVTGDVANKIGTYLKALAARDNGIPFYAALPSPTFDWELKDGIKEIPIEERSSEEVCYVNGYSDGAARSVRICPDHTDARNFAFDVTPAGLVTGLITERGICDASEEGILNLYPEMREKT